MKKVKLIAVILATVLVLGAIIGGTFAYLTDTEGVVNVMTVGNVDISLHEYSLILSRARCLSPLSEALRAPRTDGECLSRQQTLWIRS